MKKRELLDGQLPVCLNESVNNDCEYDTEYRSDTKMNGKTKGQCQHCHVKDNGAGQTEGFSVVEPGKGTVGGEIADEAAENGSD